MVSLLVLQVISSGKDLLIEFQSDAIKERQGFAATFEYVDDTVTTTTTQRTITTTQTHTMSSKL